MFQIACSGHSTNITPTTMARTMSTRVERLRYQPAVMIATPASTQIHHGSHSVGEKCLTGLAFVSSGGRATPFHRPSSVCLTAPGTGIQDGSVKFPFGMSFV